MAYRTLYFILLSCLVLCCTNKSSKNEVANLDSVQTARLVVKSIDVPNEETTHAYYDTARVPIKYLPEENKETDIYLVVEVMPEFPNGLKALFDFIYDDFCSNYIEMAKYSIDTASTSFLYVTPFGQSSRISSSNLLISVFPFPANQCSFSKLLCIRLLLLLHF